MGVTWAALAAVTVLLLGGIAAGCGDGGDETTPPPTDTGTTTEETEGAEEEGAGGEEAEGGEEEAEGQPEGGGAGGIEASAGNAKAGAQIFAQNCSVCHGTKGSGAATGPNLQEPQLAQEPEQVVNQVIEGGGGMPSFGDQLSDKEIADVAAYVVEDVSQR